MALIFSTLFAYVFYFGSCLTVENLNVIQSIVTLWTYYIFLNFEY